MRDFLPLPNLRTAQVQDLGDHYRVEVEGIAAPSACPACHGPLYCHGSQRQTYPDVPLRGKRVVVEIARKRYRCKMCGKTLFEPLPAMDGKRLATTRLVRHIEQHCLRKTFAELSREIGVNDKTIRHVFDDYVARLKETVVFETPEVLGLDELKIIGEYRALLTNVDKMAMFDILPTRSKADLTAYFKAVPGKDKVRILTISLWNAYRQVAHDQFPGRMVVADRLHVVRMANDSLEKVHKAVRDGLEPKDRLKLKGARSLLLTRGHDLSDKERAKVERWMESFPALEAAYRAKEAFHDIYRHRSKDDAMRAAQEWLQSIDKDVVWAFRETKGVLKSWWTEVFNHYDYHVSEAYTESISGLAEGLGCMGRGYSFDVIRARLVFDDAARKAARTTRRRSARKGGPHEDDVVIEYGSYLPTLAKKLEAREFA